MAGFFAAALPAIFSTEEALPALTLAGDAAATDLGTVGSLDAATAVGSGLTAGMPSAVAGLEGTAASMLAPYASDAASTGVLGADAATAVAPAVPTGAAAIPAAAGSATYTPGGPFTPEMSANAVNTANAAAAAGNSSGILSNLDPIKQGFSDATDWIEKHKTATYLGLLGAKSLFGPSYAQPTVKKPTGLAMNMNLSPNFQGQRSISDSSVYTPSYGVPTAAQGGILSFDQGGIAAMANGGQGVGAQGMGNAQSYPGARLDMTQYATPSQMPTSSAVINSDYEMKTDPYTGQPNGMAEGGIAGYAGGGFAVNQGTQNTKMPNAGTTNTPTPTYHPAYNPMSMYGYNNPMNGMSGIYGNYMGPGSNSWFNQLNQLNQQSTPGISPNFQPARDVTPQVYQPQYAAGGVLAFKEGTPDNSHISYLSAESPWKTNQDNDANTALLSPHDAAAYRQKKLENLVGFANRGKLNSSITLGQINHIPAAQQYQQAAQQAQDAAQPQAAQGMPVQEAASGGIMGYSLGGYATGGNPRLLKGPGDGMSDNIPAVIANKQPARLADGEFVVPADVVSHLGNGSTDAGAKKLHTMMDTVRKARTGSKKQGKQIDPNKFLPA